LEEEEEESGTLVLNVHRRRKQKVAFTMPSLGEF